MPHQAGKYSSPSPVEGLRQIANEIEGLPEWIKQVISAEQLHEVRPLDRGMQRLGQLAEAAVDLGAFCTAEYAEFLNEVRAVRLKDGSESQVAYLAAMRVCPNLVVGLGLEGCFGPACHEIAQAIRIEADNLDPEADRAEPAPTASPTTTPIVFISSTIEDLEKHRGKARDAINQFGFVPRMKEYFAARGDKGPLAVCLEKVSGPCTERAADVLVLIVAHRYGWVPEDQPGSDRKSITWLECEEAMKNGKEVLAFVVDKECDWPGELREENRIAEETARRTGTPELLREVQSNVDWLGRFKTWIDKHCTRATFTTPESLHGAVLAALHDWQKRHLNDVA